MFCTKIFHQNSKFWGPGTKNDHFRAKNVIFRILGNIDYLRSTNLRKSSYINEYSSFSFYPINAYDSLKWPEEACPDNVFGRFLLFGILARKKLENTRVFRFFAREKSVKRKSQNRPKTLSEHASSSHFKLSYASSYAWPDFALTYTKILLFSCSF